MNTANVLAWLIGAGFAVTLGLAYLWYETDKARKFYKKLWNESERDLKLMVALSKQINESNDYLIRTNKDLVELVEQLRRENAEDGEGEEWKTQE